MNRTRQFSGLVLAVLLAMGALLACSKSKDGQAHAKRIKAEIVYYAIPG